MSAQAIMSAQTFSQLKEIQMSKTVYIVWIGVEPVAKYLDVKAALERAHEIWNGRDGRSPFSSVFVEITEED